MADHTLPTKARPPGGGQSSQRGLSQKAGERLLMITELRTIAADDLWMSPYFKRPTLAIHFTWKQDWSSVRKVLPRIERELAPFEVRPHWGKLFTIPSAQLQQRYLDVRRLQTARGGT